MIYLVLSDFHLGKGRFFNNGQTNILEDFYEDDRFSEFLEYHSSGKYSWAHVHLVLNGDILNLIQIDSYGTYAHILDDNAAVKALNAIKKGHERFFEALRKFLDSPNKKLTFVIGNHDIGLAFDGVQSRLKEIVGNKLNVVHELQVDGIHVEHGHRFEVINAVPKNKLFTKGPRGTQILNLPWGSLFCINVLPKLKKYRPMIDKVRPIASYVKWTLFHDIGFFIKMGVMVVKYLISSNFDIYTKQNRNFKTTLKLLKQITIYPHYGRRAKSILKRNPHIHTVVMGHTHVQEWRRFPNGKYYFNTGTWNSIPSIDAGLHESHTKLTYCFLDVNTKTKELRKAGLHLWQGKWRPFRQEMSIN